jgi:hypothetical protein
MNPVDISCGVNLCSLCKVDNIYIHTFLYLYCSLLRRVVAGYQCFKGTYCLHFQGTNEPVWENNFLCKEVWSFKLSLICFLPLLVQHRKLLSQHGSHVPLCPSKTLVLGYKVLQLRTYII